MGVLRTVALVILAISGFTFIALFGRLPAFRKTPIGFLHRAVWIYIPHGIAYLDSNLLDGRLLYCWNRTGSYVLRENHPLVLIFFVSLLVAGEYLFIPSAWPRIPIIHHICVPVVAILPYMLLYLSVVTKSFITPDNHAEEMQRYPYDRILFHPGNCCDTCQFLKPARSKHCSICNACISRHDHHCVWLTNCVGLHNYHYFLSLMLSLSVLLIYGSCLGHALLRQTLDALTPLELRSTMHWSGFTSWYTFFNLWAVAIAADVRIGAVYLLALMTAPLALSFLAYHSYLIWAGMTTNETAKWSTWKDDVVDGFVYKSTKTEVFGDSLPIEFQQQHPTWPVSSDQMLIVTDGKPPLEGFMLSATSNEIDQEENTDAPVDSRWVRVQSLNDVDNIYDLGFWDNLRDAVKLSIRRRKLPI